MLMVLFLTQKKLLRNGYLKLLESRKRKFSKEKSQLSLT
jgi:hypothetical protein